MKKRTLKQANERIRNLENCLSRIVFKMNGLVDRVGFIHEDLLMFIDRSRDDKWCQQIKRSLIKAKE